MRISSRRTPQRIISFLVCALSLPLHAADPPTATLIEGSHYKRAQPILAARLKANPNDAQSWYEMSKVSAAFQRWDQAIQQAEKAVSLNHKNAEFQAALADAVVSKLGSSQAGMFAKMSLARRFRKEVDLALQLDPNNLDANSDLLEFCLEAPGIVGGDNQKAADIADHMLRVNPARGYLLKLDIATHQKRAASELEGLIQQAITADPKLYYARTQAANFYITQAGAALAHAALLHAALVQAEGQAREAIRLDPGRAAAYTALATIYAQQTRWKDLDTIIADSEREVPDDLAPFYQAAKAILLNTQNPDLHSPDLHSPDLHGDALPRAEKYLRTYLSQPPEGNEPNAAAAHWRLGLVLEKEGHKDQAKQELQQAVTLEPDFEPAKKDLKRLQ
jgi:tetratricopeptide (TPR) repeat protein